LRNNKSYGALKWVSIGQPRLIWNWNDTDSLIRRDEYLAFKLQMLTDFDRLNLVEEVKRVKGVDVSKNAFTNLRPNDLTCEIDVYDTDTKESFILRGLLYIGFVIKKWLEFRLFLALILVGFLALFDSPRRDKTESGCRGKVHKTTGCHYRFCLKRNFAVNFSTS